MGILKTVELADFAEKNAKRIHILKTRRVGKLRREKCQKNGNPEKMRIRMLLFDRAK